jgi:allantoinase
MKAGDFRTAWGGIAGVQSTLLVLLDRRYHGSRLTLERIAHLLSMNPARRFRIAGKGAIEHGNDADLVLVDLTTSRTLQKEHLQQRHKMSPYVGATFHGVVRATLRRGETIFLDGHVTAQTCGRFVRPEPVR